IFVKWFDASTPLTAVPQARVHAPGEPREPTQHPPIVRRFEVQPCSRPPRPPRGRPRPPADRRPDVSRPPPPAQTAPAAKPGFFVSEDTYDRPASPVRFPRSRWGIARRAARPGVPPLPGGDGPRLSVRHGVWRDPAGEVGGGLAAAVVDLRRGEVGAGEAGRTGDDLPLPGVRVPGVVCVW